MYKKHFYFPFYPDRWSKGTKTLTIAEKGAYWELLIYQFEHGSIPHKNIDKLCLICGGGVDKTFDFSDILKNFPDGVNHTMFEVKEGLNKKSELAKKAIETRYGRNTDVCTDEDTDVLLSKSKSKVKDKSITKDKEDSLVPIGTSVCEDVVEYWNKMAEAFGLAKLSKLTDSRKAKLQIRLNEGFDIISLYHKIKESQFLLGQNNGGWRVDFDWLIANDKNFLKVMEGKYISKVVDKSHKIHNDIREAVEEMDDYMKGSIEDGH